jgi:hypothetical protein
VTSSFPSSIERDASVFDFLIFIHSFLDSCESLFLLARSYLKLIFVNVQPTTPSNNLHPTSKLRITNNEEPTMSTTENTEERKVIKFTSSGLKHDVRLKVFDIDFHVLSVILKLYSGFFRKFLDSPEKKIPASAEFAYEYVT